MQQPAENFPRLKPRDLISQMSEKYERSHFLDGWEMSPQLPSNPAQTELGSKLQNLTQRWENGCRYFREHACWSPPQLIPGLPTVCRAIHRVGHCECLWLMGNQDVQTLDWKPRTKLGTVWNQNWDLASQLSGSPWNPVCWVKEPKPGEAKSQTEHSTSKPHATSRKRRQCHTPAICRANILFWSCLRLHSRTKSLNRIYFLILKYVFILYFYLRLHCSKHPIMDTDKAKATDFTFMYL